MIRLLRIVPYLTITRFLNLQQTAGQYTSVLGNSLVEMTISLSYERSLTLATIETVNKITEQFGMNPVFKFEETLNREVVVYTIR